MRRFLRTATVRLALLYLGLFLGSVGVILWVVYGLTAGFVERELSDAIGGEVAGLRQQYEARGLPGLIDAVRTRSADPHNNAIYLLAGPTGTPLVGNISGWPEGAPDESGRLHFRVADSGGPAGQPATAQAAVFTLPGNLRLLVGRDMSELDWLRGRITASLGWIAAVAASLGVVGGVLLSRGMLHRIEEVNRTTRRIMAGDLSGRVPRAGNDDEIDHLADNLNAMLDQIERLMTSMRQVTENIAHDLRTPLSRLRARIELTLLHPGDDPEPYRAALRDALSEADRLLATFRALLSIAEASSEARRADFAAVDLSELVRQVADLYEPVADEAGLTFSAAVHATPVVRGDAQLLSQAVANLLDNAIKYTPAGGRVTLSLEGPDQGRAAALCVADTGPGIPADQRDAVLGRFVRLDTARATEGNGLGLSLVDAVARLHGARLVLDDANPGLLVRLEFPEPA